MGLTSNLGKLSNMITSTGSAVGIGTTSPSYKLSVVGPNGGTAISWTDTLNNTGYLSIRASAASIGADNNLLFETASSEKMRITTGGNVGIGTTNPSYPLDVQYGGNVSQRIRNTGAGGTATLLLETANTFSGTSQAYVQCIGSTGGGQSQLVFATAGASGDTTGTERMRITSGGQLLVGKTTSLDSTRIVDINGNFYSGGSSAGIFFQNRPSSNVFGWYGNSQLYAFNTDFGNIAQIAASNGAYTALSDINKKKDFEESVIGLDAILGLKPTLYRMKSDDETSDKYLGFIAQEVKEFIPQAYVESGEDDNKFIGLDYQAITATLVKAVQEQQKQIEELKSLINK